MKVLEADGIVQVIEGREVLVGLDLSLEQGEIPGLLGSKGSGKSTLLKILSGMQEPSADSSVYWEQFSAHPVLPYLARPNPAGQQIFVGLFTALSYLAGGGHHSYRHVRGPAPAGRCGGQPAFTLPAAVCSAASDHPFGLLPAWWLLYRTLMKIELP